jgi:hypothetical protein
MIKGDICITVPNFVDAHRDDFKISMLHIDTDLYEPANMSFDRLWEFVSPGGVVFFHDYGDKKWPGIQLIVDRFASRCQDSFSIHVFSDDKLHACIIFKWSHLVNHQEFSD